MGRKQIHKTRKDAVKSAVNAVRMREKENEVVRMTIPVSMATRAIINDLCAKTKLTQRDIIEKMASHYYEKYKERELKL